MKYLVSITTEVGPYQSEVEADALAEAVRKALRDVPHTESDVVLRATISIVPIQERKRGEA